jgi:hypothetical protein
LAEGADRLVAEIGLAAGAVLWAPLPLPPTEYERDFATPASQQEFRRLLAAAERIFCVLPPEKLTADFLSPRVRAECYAAVGAYIAWYSQVLIVLWDGIPRDALGGTSQIFEFRRWGVPAEFRPRIEQTSAEQEGLLRPAAGSGFIYHVATPRRGSAPASNLGTAVRVYPLFPQDLITLKQENGRPAPKST